MYYLAYALSKRMTGSGLYVRYGSNKISEVEIHKHADYTWVKCPDRDLVFTQYLTENKGYRPLNENFDELIVLDPYVKDSVISKYIEYFLISYWYHKKTLGMYSDNPLIKIIGDSGGFQLRTKQSEYLDPLDVINWANSAIDIQVGLDVPTFGNEFDYFKAHLKVLNKNNEVFFQHKRDDLDILLVIHGYDLKSQRYWIDNVDTSYPFYGLAIGSSYFNSVLYGMRVILEALDSFSYKYNHILGVSSFSVIPMLAWMGKYFKTLTSDSSSVMRQAGNSCIFVNRPGKTPYAVQLSNKKLTRHISRTIPCSCPICTRIRYTDIYSLTNFVPYVYPATVWHNAIVVQEYVKYWNNLASVMDVKEYQKEISYLLKRHPNHKDLLACIPFITDSRNGVPFSELDPKIQFYTSTETGITPNCSMLFDTVSSLGDYETKKHRDIVLGNYLTEDEITALGLTFKSNVNIIERTKKKEKSKTKLAPIGNKPKNITKIKQAKDKVGVVRLKRKKREKKFESPT